MNRKKINKLKQSRINRTRMTLSGNHDKPRLAVFRSLRHIYAQIIDDKKGITLASFSTMKPEIREEIIGKKKVQQAFMVGEQLGKIAVLQGIENIVFDRHGRKFHGRVKALADGARKGGLKF